MGAAFAAFRSELIFDDEHLGIEQLAATATVEYRLSPRWTLSASAGGLFDGRLIIQGVPLNFGAGGVVSLGASWLALDQAQARPFVMVSGSLAGSLVKAQPTNYAAIDVRVAGSVGYTLFDRLTVYAAARLFGGPVLWRHQVGTDAYHVQLGAGFALGLPGGLDVSAEVIPLGEQRVVAGVGFSF